MEKALVSAAADGDASTVAMLLSPPSMNRGWFLPKAVEPFLGTVLTVVQAGLGIVTTSPSSSE